MMRRREMFPHLEAPDGVVYEWKVTEILGVPVDPDDLEDYELAGWTPVPADRHPGERVETLGCRLMEIPVDTHARLQDELTRFAKAHEGQDFINQIAKRNCPAGFEFIANPPDLNHVLTENGWQPASLVRAMEDADEHEHGGVDAL